MYIRSQLFTSSVLPFLLLSSLPALSPSPSSCSYHSTTSGLVLSCTGLNTTADISEDDIETVQTVVRVEITDSNVDCVDLSHFRRFPNLQVIKVTKSGLKKAICSGHAMRHRKATHHLRFLLSLDLSNNWLSYLDNSITSLHQLERINLSHNNLSMINMVFSTFTSLKYLNISNNNLTDNLQRQTLESLPATLEHLDLSGNPWTCSPSLSWLYPWSLGLSPSLRDQLDQVHCNVINSHQVSPLLQVMQYYTTNVNPFCPPKCSCYFYHFAAHQDMSPSYTVLVNCSMQGLTTFPTLPPHTTMLDLSHNNLSHHSYSSLDLPAQNYGEVSGLILSHNHLPAIHNKLTKMRLHRAFKADHNLLSEIPYDFSLLLQSYAKNQITLGHNQWRCSCNAEITSTVIIF